jgi:hypothetical protein
MEANHGAQIVGIYLVNNRNISGRLPSLDACVACQSKNLMADEVPVVTIGTIVTTFFRYRLMGIIVIDKFY